MRSNNIRSHIVCRMLHRGKGINVLPQRKYNNATRMLSGTSTNTGAPLTNTVNLAATFMTATFFVIFFYISIGSLICKGTYGTCSIGLSCTKNYFGIFMSLRLIFTGEVQVDIRFLVTFKSKESFKRYIKTIFFEQCTTLRACLIRQVTAGTSILNRRCNFRGFKL